MNASIGDRADEQCVKLILATKIPIIDSAYRAEKHVIITETTVKCKCGWKLQCVSIDASADPCQGSYLVYVHACVNPKCSTCSSTEDLGHSDVCPMCMELDLEEIDEALHATL